MSQTACAQEFDVVCLGGRVAGEAIAVGVEDSGLTLARENGRTRDEAAQDSAAHVEGAHR